MDISKKKPANAALVFKDIGLYMKIMNNDDNSILCCFVSVELTQQSLNNS